MNLDELRLALPALVPITVGLLLLALAAAIAEAVVLSRRGHHDWHAFWASLGVAVGRRVVDAAGLSLAAPLLAWAHAHRVTSLPLETAGAMAVLFLGQELCYYGFHRASHRMRWFWATHAVHHSPNELTLAASMRLGWTSKLSGATVFYLPLVWLGFPPAAVLGTLALNLLYQFWLHATWIPRLGPLEWVLNTPSHHRVHHGANPEYLDCNYGGVLIVFDRLFGTFVAEREDVPIRYGLTTPLLTNNPLRIVLHEWARLGRDLMAAKGPGQAARVLFGPP